MTVHVQKMNLETHKIIFERIPPLGYNTKLAYALSENANLFPKYFHFPYFVFFHVDFIEHYFGYCARFNIREVNHNICDWLKLKTILLAVPSLIT